MDRRFVRVPRGGAAYRAGTPPHGGTPSRGRHGSREGRALPGPSAPDGAAREAVLPDGPRAGRAGVEYDRRWCGEARAALGGVLLALTLALGVDAATGALTPLRALLWCLLAVVVLLVLVPARVSAHTGLLVSRGVRRRAVRTDLLVLARWYDGPSERLVLRDAWGGRVELDPGLLVANPPLWHLVRDDVLACLRRGTVVSGADRLDRLVSRVDRETARTVFHVSDLH